MSERKRTVFLITLDSCRWDSYRFARTPFFGSLGRAVSGRSHADSTLASHMSLLSGCLPHCERWHGKKSISGPWLPYELKKVGYRTIGAVSLPFLDHRFGFGRGFDVYNDYPTNALSAQQVSLVPLDENLDAIHKNLSGEDFIFLNVGETHFPYRNKFDFHHKGDWEAHVADLIHKFSERKPCDFPPDIFHRMHDAQVEQVEWVDTKLGEFAKHLPDDTIWIVTADHGELFGEHHLYGHGHGSYPEEITVPVLVNDWSALRMGE